LRGYRRALTARAVARAKLNSPIHQFTNSQINKMTIDDWLKAACEDAERRGLPELKPLLESLARSMAALRDADRLIDRGYGNP
jgi:hypothetical protein